MTKMFNMGGSMKKILGVFFALVLAGSAQEVLTNDSVVRMVKSGLGEGLILSMIQNQPGKYSLSPEDLNKLKADGVSATPKRAANSWRPRCSCVFTVLVVRPRTRAIWANTLFS